MNRNYWHSGLCLIALALGGASAWAQSTSLPAQANGAPKPAAPKKPSLTYSDVYPEASGSEFSVDVPCFSEKSRCVIGMRQCDDVIHDAVQRNVDYYARQEKMMREYGVMVTTGTGPHLEVPKACDVCNPDDYAKIRGGGCGPISKAKITLNSSNSTAHAEFLMGQSSPGDPALGKMDNSIRSGLMLHALRFYIREVNKEIAGKSLRITSDACRKAGEDVRDLAFSRNGQSTSSQKASKVLLSVLPEEWIKNFCGVEGNVRLESGRKVASMCTEIGKTTQFVSELEKYRAQSCALEAARAATESAFFNLAQCEVLSRWKKDVFPKIDMPRSSGASTKSALTQFLEQGAGEKCGRRAESDTKKFPGVVGCVPPFGKKSKCEKKASKVFNKCWEQEVPAAALQFAEQTWGSCSSSRDLSAGVSGIDLDPLTDKNGGVK